MRSKLGAVRQEIAEAEGARDKALLAHKAAQQASAEWGATKAGRVLLLGAGSLLVYQECFPPMW